MTGISQNAKNGNLPEFGEAIATASKALCGFTEAAAQVMLLRWSLECPCFPSPTSSQPDTLAENSKSYACKANCMETGDLSPS